MRSKNLKLTPILRKLSHKKKKYFLFLFLIFSGLVYLTMKFSNQNLIINSYKLPEEIDLIEYILEKSDKALKFDTRSEQNSYFGGLKNLYGLKPIKMTLQTTVFLFKKYENENYLKLNNEKEYSFFKKALIQEENEFLKVHDLMIKNSSYFQNKFKNSKNIIIKRAIIRKETNTQEDKVSLKLNHPNILETFKSYRIIHFNNEDEKQEIVFLFSEYMKYRISNKYVKMDENIIRNILKDVLKGLAYMHEHNIMHLDIKIANIMGNLVLDNEKYENNSETNFENKNGNNFNENEKNKNAENNFENNENNFEINSFNNSDQNSKNNTFQENDSKNNAFQNNGSNSNSNKDSENIFYDKNLKNSSVEEFLKKKNKIFKLIDFGYARELQSNQKEMKIPSKSYGTFPYKPPEVVFQNIHGLKSDIWCVGAVAWFLILGKVPFYHENGEKNSSLYKNFLLGKKKHFFYPNTSTELKDFVLKTMKRDRDLRPSAKSLLNHPFIRNEKFRDESEFSESDERSGL